MRTIEGRFIDNNNKNKNNQMVKALIIFFLILYNKITAVIK